MWAALTLDGVLLGPERRRESATLAAAFYLHKVCCIENGDRLLRPELIHEIEKVGPLDPWELAEALIFYFLNALSPPLRPPVTRVGRVAQVQAAFKEQNLRYGELSGHAERDLTELLDAAHSNGGGLRGFRAALGYDSIDGYILTRGHLGATEQEAALPEDASFDEIDRAEARHEHYVGRLVEEFYLGESLFERFYKLSATVPTTPGLLAQEVSQVPLEDLRSLRQHMKLALVSARRLEETTMLLTQLGLGDVFDLVSSQEIAQGRPLTLDVKRLRDEILAKDSEPDTLYFLSDSPGEVRQAHKSGFAPLGVTRDRTLRKPLMEAGASAVMRKVETLARAQAKKIE